MELHTWWVFVVMTFFVPATPGPNMLLVMSAGALAEYERLWQKRFGKMHEALYKIRKIIGRLGQKRLDELEKRLPPSEPGESC